MLRWNGSRWSTVHVPSPTNTATLSGVACTSSRDCRAIGNYFDGAGNLRNQALHWDGQGWLRVRMPGPGHDESGLNAVACASGKSCWVVGGCTEARSLPTSSFIGMEHDGQRFRSRIRLSEEERT